MSLDTHPSDSLGQLALAVRRALIDRREVLEVAGLQMRFQRAGEHFEHDGRKALAFGTGAYTKGPSDGTWMFEGAVKLETLVDKQLRLMTEAARCELAARLAAALRPAEPVSAEPERKRTFSPA